jgi:hypothetical protein
MMTSPMGLPFPRCNKSRQKWSRNDECIIIPMGGGGAREASTWI